MRSSIAAQSWASVPPDWAVTIPAGDTRLELRTAITDDLLHENDENMVFVVQQNSANLVDSWWVHQTVVIHDNDSLAPGGPGFSPSRITAGSAPQVDEGQAAVASYSLDHALQGDALAPYLRQMGVRLRRRVGIDQQPLVVAQHERPDLHRPRLPHETVDGGGGGPAGSPAARR